MNNTIKVIAGTFLPMACTHEDVELVGAIVTVIITGIAVSGLAVLLTMIPFVKKKLRKW